MVANFKCCAKNSQEAEMVKKTYAFVRAIADVNRLKILCALGCGAKCVCQIVPAVGISNKLASHHLRQLKKIGLLKSKREGNFIRYTLDRTMLREYKKIFNQVIN